MAAGKEIEQLGGKTGTLNDGNYREGEQLRKALKSESNMNMQEIATLLNMTRQNLSYHLRKVILDDDFKRLIREKLNIENSESGFHLVGKQVSGINTKLANEIRQLKAVVKTLMQSHAKLVSKITGRGVEDIWDDIDQDIKINLRDIV